jgi:O-antigen ligase
MAKSSISLPPAVVTSAAVLAVISFAVALAVMILIPDDPWLQALPLAVAAIAGLMPVVVALLAGERWAFVVGLAVLLFVTDTSFRSRTWNDKSWDWQVLMKGLVWLGCGFAGILRLGRTARLLEKPPAALILVFLLIIGASTAWSPVPSYTLQAAVAFLMMFAFALACADILDAHSLLVAIALGFGLIVLPSLAIAPFAMGITHTSPGSTGEADRLRGLTDHPIPMAEIAAMFTFACLALRSRSRGVGKRMMLLLLALAGVVTALLTHSRIPVMAMIAAAAGFAAYRKGGPLLMAPVLVACIGGVLLLDSLAGFASFLPADLLELIARSGSSKEILTLSGRLIIWPYAMDRIAEAPLLGHGHASGIEVFKGFAPWKIVHAHNAYLQALLYVGVVGTLPLLGGLLAQLRVFLRQPEPVRDIILLYTLLSGITEQSLLSNLPSGGVVLWMVSVGMAAKVWEKKGGRKIQTAPETINYVARPTFPASGYRNRH